MQAYPKKLTVGKTVYKIDYKNKSAATIHGRVYYGEKIIMYMNKNKAVERNTFWHELTHAILYEMNNELCHDETFVTEFADKLSGAIDSARF